MCPPLTLSSSNRQKLRVLCLHGFRTSGFVMETQLAKLDRSVLDLLDMVCLDAPYPAAGKSDVEGFFDPPFYEWFQFKKTDDGATYTNLGECIEFISDVMHKQGPFDGLLGFSQDAFLAAALAGMQEQGLALTSLPTLRFVMIISGGVLSGKHQWKDCYSKPIQCPSVHLIGWKDLLQFICFFCSNFVFSYLIKDAAMHAGANDFLKSSNEELLTKFENPVVVRHGARHTIPRLDEKAALPLKTFLQNILGSFQEQEDYLD